MRFLLQLHLTRNVCRNLPTAHVSSYISLILKFGPPPSGSSLRGATCHSAACERHEASVMALMAGSFIKLMRSHAAKVHYVHLALTRCLLVVTVVLI